MALMSLDFSAVENLHELMFKSLKKNNFFLFLMF